MLSAFSSSLLGFFSNQVLWNSGIACMCFFKVHCSIIFYGSMMFASIHTLYTCNVLLVFTIYFKLVTAAILKCLFSSFYVSRMKSKIGLKSDSGFFVLPPI